MSFERTNNGLSNAHLFHSVDFIIYVEGRYEENNNDMVSFDQYFWKSIVSIVASKSQFKVISRGSKTNLISIADEVIAGRISNTLVALDRDYDIDCGGCLSHARVIYTRGYSWENDIWDSEALMSLVEQLYVGDEISADKAVELQKNVASFLRKARRVARINIAAKQNGMEYVILSDDMKGLVSLKKNKLPSFNQTFFHAAVRKNNITRPIKLTYEVKLTNDHIQGHLLAHFGYHFVCQALAKLGQKGTICLTFLSSLAINLFKHRLQNSESSRRAYYEECFSNAIL